MSSRACCLKIKECSGVIDGQTDGMLFLIEDAIKTDTELPGDLEKRIVNLLDNFIKEAGEINTALKTLLQI